MGSAISWKPLVAASGAAAFLALASATHSEAAIAPAEILFETGFEAEEGYDPELTLIGQNGWLGVGSGGNGLVSDFFEGLGQQAFVGFNPPVDTNDVLNVWRPVNTAPASDRPVVHFSVFMEIVDSENGGRDDFRWSVYNTNGFRFFSLDFDNSAAEVNYALDDGGFVATGFGFENGAFYELDLWMNLDRNLWSARMNGQVIVNSVSMTTTGLDLHFGDVDAVWAIRDASNPGDNFMVFDEYWIESSASSSIPPVLEWIRYQDGEAMFRFYGEEGLDYSIEVSEDLVEWFTLGTYLAPSGGVFDFQDPTASEHPRGFYRARALP